MQKTEQQEITNQVQPSKSEGREYQTARVSLNFIKSH